MENQTTSKSSLFDVLKTFWLGMSPQKWTFYFILFAFSASNIVGLLIPIEYKKFFDVLSQATDKVLAAPTLIRIIFIVLGINGLSWLLFRVGMLFLNDFESKTMMRLKQTSFNYLIDHSYNFFSNNFAGALVQRVNRLHRAFERLFDTFVFSFIPLLINIVIVIAVVWLQQKGIAVAILCWVVMMVTVNYLFSRWKLKYDLASAEADTKTTALLADVISNQNTVSSFTASQYEKHRFSGVSNDQAKAVKKTWNFGLVADSIQGASVILIEFLVFYFAIAFWRVGTITLGTFVLIQAYILGLAQRLWNFSNILRNAYEGFADSKEMVEILKLPYEIQDVSGAKVLKINRGEIEIKNVTFNFNQKRNVLDSINVDIKGGEKVALIGPSGAGKSTVVKLISRMYDLANGQILIDSQDIQKVTQNSLRESISIVPQDPILFHRTLMENIRYGRRDASDAEVINAAKLAHCDEFIDKFPLKYETYVGERGIKLSGGERQRVAIARAILKNAPILILDEATSSLDSHSESLIQDAMDKLMHGKTVIVIAHRLSTIRKMDRIIVIENGKVIEEGTHDDLVNQKGGLYKNLWSLQAGGFLS